ncbi:MAG: hypothetical protein ACFFAU_13435 [Candidatus Hodarchaeota archaeon]
MIPIKEKYKSPVVRKLLSYYFIFLIIIVIFSFITNDFTINMDSLNSAGAWLTMSEIVIGFAAAGSTNILTSMSTLQARGEPVTEKTIIQQRIKEENQSFRKPWLILLLINTILLALVVISVTT